MRLAAVVLAVVLAAACTPPEKARRPENPLTPADTASWTAGVVPVDTAASDTTVTGTALALGKGAEAVRAGHYDRAIQRLGPLVDEGPIPRHRAYGSAATWLGQAFLGRGDTVQARKIWLAGLRRDRRAEDQPPAADAADKFLRSLSPEAVRDTADLATEVFVRLLRAMGKASTTAADTTLRRHAAQLALIAPDSIAGPLSAYAEASVLPASAGPAGAESALAVSSGVLVETNTALRRWLRAQDPILATVRNERVVEHLVRVRRAEQKYAWRGRPSGLDDRGETLVRYGRPSRSISVAYENSPKRTLDVLWGGGSIKLPPLRDALRSLNISQNSFPAAENVVWTYPDLEPPLHFIFLEKSEKPGAPYLEGTSQDLLPSELRRSPRPDDSLAHLAVYAQLYNQLIPVDGRYADRYAGIMNYDAESDPPLSSFAGIQIARNKAENRQIQRDQEEVSKQKTQADLSHPEMPVALRTARFLEEDGTTRTEVYWGLRPDSLAPPSGWLDNTMRLGFEPSGSYLVQATGVLRDPGLRAWATATRLDTVSVRDIARDRPLTPPPLALSSQGEVRADSHRVALEWTQRALGIDGQPGFYVHATDTTLGPRPALSADPSGLEMSDLRLLWVPEEGNPLPESESEVRRRTIPFGRIKADRSIALGFEVYHLTFGEGDRTRYTIEYTVEQERETGGLAGLFGGTNRQETSTASTYRGSARRTREYNLLQLSEVEDLSAPTPVTVTVRVTDEVTGRSTERSISFALMPSAAP